MHKGSQKGPGAFNFNPHTHTNLKHLISRLVHHQDCRVESRDMIAVYNAYTLRLVF